MSPTPKDKVIGSYLSDPTIPDSSGHPPPWAEVPGEFKAQLHRNQVHASSTLTATHPVASHAHNTLPCHVG